MTEISNDLPIDPSNKPRPESVPDGPNKPISAESTSSTNNDADDENNGTTTVELVRAIQGGSVKTQSLKTEDKHAVMSYFLAQGLALTEIAFILKVKDRTAYRYQAAVRKANALKHDPNRDAELAGELTEEIGASISRLKRLIRDKETNAPEKIAAELAIAQLLHGRIKTLQRMGFVKEAAHKFQGELTHSVSQLPALEEIAQQAQRLVEVQAQLGIGDDSQLKRINQLQQDIAKATLAERTKLLEGEIIQPSDAEAQPERDNA